MNFKKALIGVCVLILALFAVIYFDESRGDVDVEGAANVLGAVEEEEMPSAFDVFDGIVAEGIDAPYLGEAVDFENNLLYMEGVWVGGLVDGFEDLLGNQIGFEVVEGDNFPGIVGRLDVSSDLARGEELKNYVGEFVKGFLIGVGFNEEALVEKVVVVRGFGMNKMSVNWDVISQEAMLVLGAAEMNEVVGTDLEFYYGVSDEGIFVAALYPNFEEYEASGEFEGVKVLKEERLREALGKFDYLP